MTHPPARHRALTSLFTGLLTALPLAALAPSAGAAPPAPAPAARDGVLRHAAHGPLPAQRSGTRVPEARDAAGPPTRVSTTTGTRSVLVVPVYATARDGWTRTGLHAQVQGRADDYFREVSYGALGLTATTLGWRRVAAPLPCRDFSDMKRVGAAAARAAGRDVKAFDSVVIYASARDCPAGVPSEADVRDRYVLMRGDMAPLVHELGHNLGLGHANATYCTDARSRPVALSDTCTHEEYGDPYDAMGTQDHHFNAPHKAALGWLAGRTRRVTSTGTTWLRAYESAGRGTVALRVEAGYRTYWLEARRPIGVDHLLPTTLTDGALVHLDDSGSTLLLDMTPGTPYERDQDLSPGRSWTDPERSVRISVGTRTGSGLPVTVTYLPGFAPPVQALAATAGPDVLITWKGWPGRTPDAVAVRRNAPGGACPGTRHEGTAVGGTSWRTSQADRVTEGQYVCYSLFARYGDRWSPPASINPGCSTAAARPGEVSAFC